VLDAKEEQIDAYLGKARVPLLSLASEQVISGEGYLDLCCLQDFI